MKIFGAKVHIIIRSVPVCQFLAREFKFLGLFTFATLSAAAFSAKIQFEILIQIWILRLFNIYKQIFAYLESFSFSYEFDIE